MPRCHQARAFRRARRSLAIAVLGSVLSNFKNAHGQRGLNVAVIRSTDKGLTWSKPVIVAKLNTVGVTDPDNGHDVRTGDIIPDIAVDALSGALYVVWQDSRFSGGRHDDIAFSSSTDGGLTWSMPIKVNKTPVPVAAFTPSVDVAADHTVGVTYYDFRANDASPGLPTDYFLVHSHTGGTSWDPETPVTPTSFDMESAPDARGYFVGDYEGLTHVGSRFMPLFVQSVVAGAVQPTSSVVDTTNRTDAFVTTVGGRGRPHDAIGLRASGSRARACGGREKPPSATPARARPGSRARMLADDGE